MNTEFEHSVPAKDSGYWLQQADEMSNDNGNTGNKSNVTIGASSYVDITKYKLIDTNNIRLPIKAVDIAPVQATGGIQPMPVTDTFGSSYDPSNVPFASMCGVRQCYPEPASPMRETDRVSRVWLAPYISPDNNVHLGELVYFISRQSNWAGIEKDIK